MNKSRSVPHNEYEFKVGNKTFSGSNTCGNYSTGDRLSVDYLPSNPKNNRIAGQGTSPLMFVFFSLVGVALIIAGVYQVKNDTELITD